MYDYDGDICWWNFAVWLSWPHVIRSCVTWCPGRGSGIFHRLVWLDIEYIVFIWYAAGVFSACLTYSDVWLQIAGILYSARASAGLISRTIPIAFEGFNMVGFRRPPYLHGIINLSSRRQLVSLVTVDTEDVKLVTVGTQNGVWHTGAQYILLVLTIVFVGSSWQPFVWHRSICVSEWYEGSQSDRFECGWAHSSVSAGENRIFCFRAIFSEFSW